MIYIMLKIVQAYIIGENGVNVIVNTTDTKSTKECTEEFVHDWKEAHNK